MESIREFCGREVMAFTTPHLASKRLQSIHPLFDELEKVRHQRWAQLRSDEWRQACNRAKECIFSPQDVTIVDEKVTFSGSVDRESLRTCLQAFMPWKKGPFDFFGIHIDAEWRSDWKWQRIRPHLRVGARFADVGCNNGYFMYRLEKECSPEIVVGMEPVEKYWHHFELSESCRTPNDRLLLEPIGVEQLGLFPQFFDQILLLGILYHHTDPVRILRECLAALRKGGELIVDCQGMAGEDPHVFVPPGKYAGATGIWWVPTVSALKNWLKRAGFQHQEVFFSEPLSTDEQRPTPWAPLQSLQDFLSADGKTIEGHPLPWRHYIKAWR